MAAKEGRSTGDDDGSIFSYVKNNVGESLLENGGSLYERVKTITEGFTGQATTQAKEVLAQAEQTELWGNGAHVLKNVKSVTDDLTVKASGHAKVALAQAEKTELWQSGAQVAKASLAQAEQYRDQLAQDYIPHVVHYLPPKVKEIAQQQSPEHFFLVGAIAVFLVFVLTAKCLFKQHKSTRIVKERSSQSLMDPSSIHGGGDLLRSRSLDGVSLSNNRSRANTDDTSPAARGLAPNAPPSEPISTHEEKGGPKVSCLTYETHIPPQAWTDASKQLLPTNIKMRSQVKLIIDIHRGILNSTNRKYKVALEDLQLHVKNEQGGVLELFYTSEKKVEHTFESAFQAAQFQQDVLCYQVLGKQVMNMFSVLELCHRGSIAHDGRESVLHDSEGDALIVPSAVAWDDVMRSLGCGIPDIRTALEDYTPSSLEEDLLPSLLDQYQRKRALLGQVDFFRLFVPRMRPNAIPKAQANPDRLEQLVEMRKLVAHSSLCVQAYAQAKAVVNQGWEPNWEGDQTRRIAFDENIDNAKYDSAVKNEYYEATVSRDVRCNVHSPQHMDEPGASTQSHMQGYMLVGSHAFRLPDKNVDHPLAHDKDPIANVPSLREIVTSNPHLEFFSVAFFPEGPRVALVQLFVRSLPLGADPTFDRLMDRFKNGDAALRNRKLEVFIQLGPGASLSTFVWAAIKAVSYFLSWSRKGEATIPIAECGAERTPFPGMTMGNYMEMHHFGGALQADNSMTNNYIAATAYVDSSQMRNVVFRTLYERLEDSALQSSIVDFSYVLEGTQADELPERVLGTVRYVFASPQKNALPIEYSKKIVTRADEIINVDVSAMEGTREGNSETQERTTITASITAMSLRRNKKDDQSDHAFHESRESEYPYKAAVDSLVEILEGIQVPFRRDGLSEDEMKVAMEIEDFNEGHSALNRDGREDMVLLPILVKMNRQDLLRYYLGSNCDLKKAVVCIVESSAWRGTTFPINLQSCRVELQSGQFFQQGKDKFGNPVFYFRNMCVGPWRKDPDGLINAVLHRLETSINELAKHKPDVKICLVVLLGKPKVVDKKAQKEKSDKKKKTGEINEEKQEKKNTENDDQNDEEEDDNEEEKEEEKEEEDGSKSWSPLTAGVNPRLQPGFSYHVHTNQELLKRLVALVSKHYPERLYKAILVPGTGRGYGYWGTAVGTQLGIRNSIPSSRTRAKCFILHRIVELKDFIPDNELVTIVGGSNEIAKDVFECK